MIGIIETVTTQENISEYDLCKQNKSFDKTLFILITALVRLRITW